MLSSQKSSPSDLALLPSVVGAGAAAAAASTAVDTVAVCGFDPRRIAQRASWQASGRADKLDGSKKH